jgi:hypothetical protein
MTRHFERPQKFLTAAVDQLIAEVVQKHKINKVGCNVCLSKFWTGLCVVKDQQLVDPKGIHTREFK